jgi:hypothetical protein
MPLIGEAWQNYFRITDSPAFANVNHGFLEEILFNAQ